ncbi:MAG: oxidoreductase [bacterium]|nr:oxidoreductase [bacterium]
MGTFCLKGGETVPRWEMQKSGTTADFRGVCAVSPTTAWVSGSKGTFLRTIDGGKNWQVGTIPGASALDLRDVQAFDADTALVMSAGTPAKVYKTRDGGKTWKETYNNTKKGVFFDSMAFWDKRNGIAFSDPMDGSFLLITTTDGGETWHRVPPKNIPAPLPGEAGFAASGTMTAVQGKTNTWFGTGGAAARVFRSTDRGKTWTAVKTPILSGKASEGIFSVVFKDAQNGIIVGGDYKKEEQNIKNVATTTDGGVTWKLIEGAQPAGFRECAAYVPGTGGKMVITVGPSGSDYSTDGGKTWKNFSTIGFHSVSFAPGTATAWAVGAKGRIAITVF